MNGPYPLGTHDSSVSPTEWDWEKSHLIRGKRYRVTKVFLDADGDQHDIGEEWTFVTSMFSRFDDELTICVQQESGQEWRIPMLWTPAAQEKVIECFSHFVTPVFSS